MLNMLASCELCNVELAHGSVVGEKEALAPLVLVELISEIIWSIVIK